MALTYLLLALLPLAGTALAAPSISPASPLFKRSVTCLTVGATATATWTNSAGQTCKFTGTVGSNFGENTTGGEYVTLLPPGPTSSSRGPQISRSSLCEL